MRWLRGSVAILAVTGAGCDRLADGQPGPGPASAAAPAAAPVADLQTYSGRSYADFVAAHEARFSPTALGLSATDGARLQRAMVGASGGLLEGGGAEALVFRGCAESGCADGLALVAIDVATGAVFAGVKDGAGTDVLAPNERLEALLRLNAPTRDWADVGPAPAPPEPSPPNAARP
jgi:hypothetical protein